MPDWSLKIIESSPYWGPFLVALAMILYSGGSVFKQVITILSNGLSQNIKDNTDAIKNLQASSVSGALAMQKLSDSVDALSVKVGNMPAPGVNIIK